MHVHHGFYQGAKKHADAIISVIKLAHLQAGHSLPVWVSGHSLGGAYANCVMLHLLESRSTSQLFEAGTLPPPPGRFSHTPLLAQTNPSGCNFGKEIMACCLLSVFQEMLEFWSPRHADFCV